jgi:hypothetical protein
MVSLEFFGESALFDEKNIRLRRIGSTPRPMVSRIVWSNHPAARHRLTTFKHGPRRSREAAPRASKSGGGGADHPFFDSIWFERGR